MTREILHELISRIPGSEMPTAERDPKPIWEFLRRLMKNVPDEVFHQLVQTMVQAKSTITSSAFRRRTSGSGLRCHFLLLAIPNCCLKAIALQDEEAL